MVLFAFIKAKNRFNKCKKCCNLQGVGTVTGNKLRQYQCFSVQKWPRHRYLQCFVPSTFSWHSKNRVNTSLFCDQPAKRAVIYTFVFCFAIKNTGICSVLCISGLKSIGIYSIFCIFAFFPQKTLKRKNAVTYTILLVSKSKKNGGRGKCSWRRSWATRIPSKNVSPSMVKDFWCFLGGSGRRVGGLGHASPYSAPPAPHEEPYERPRATRALWWGAGLACHIGSDQHIHRSVGSHISPRNWLL